MKKVLALLMALALMATCIVTVSASAEVTATVATLEGPFSEGDEIAIPITISEWANAYATIDITIPEYDETLLTFDGFETSSTDFGGALTASGPLGFALVASPSSDRAAAKVDGGEVCIMYFYALQDINVSTSVSVGVAVNGYTVGKEDNWLENRTLTVETVAGGIYVPGSHVCTPGEIQYDETNHWYNCADENCAEQLNKAAHEGGEATCVAKAVCSVCGASYGSINSSNHKNTEVRNAVSATCGAAGYTGDTYCADCNVMLEAGTSIPATGEHTGGVATCSSKAKCTSCGQEYGELDATNHAGGTEVRDAAGATCCEDGYTGDTYCLGCNQKIADGSVIPATGNHVASGTIQSDDTYHWYNCATIGCGNQVNKATHEGGEATCTAKAKCTVCGTEYGALDTNNHKNTEVRDAVAADCINAGYTGDTWCTDCNTMIESGETIPATGVHTAAGEIQHNDTHHWYICGVEGCGAQVGYEVHEGGRATTTEKAVCEDCGVEYGDLAQKNPGNAIVSSETVIKGNLVTVVVSLEGENALASYGAKLVFDETALELVSMAGGDFCNAVNPATKMAAGYNINDITSGSLFTATFKALKVGDTTVNVEFDGNSTCTADNVYVDMLVTAGTVTVTCAHVAGTEYVTDGTHHWKECQVDGCDEKLDYGTHAGGTATCCTKAECTVCGAAYGDFNASNHEGETEIRNAVAADCGNDGYTGDTYCLGCDQKIADGTVIPATGNHTGGTATCCTKAKCDVCGNEYGSFNANNHQGETEVRDAEAGNCGVAGYTGDTYCLGCNTMIAEGSIIPATGNHTGGEATCCAKAKCDVCGQTYGRVDSTNHKNTEVRDAEDATCGTAGYTGDTYCIDCGVIVADGTVIPATGNHTGGTATCCSKAKCTVCGTEYGSLDATNHQGETEVRNAVAATCGDEGYTGDTYCLGCDQKIADGTTIPATGNHTGGTATCCSKAICTVCGTEYGSFNATNHQGETEVRNAVAATCGTTGYTGDTYCLGCDKMIAQGTVVPATGNHTGGTATCCSKAQCTVCGTVYGELDADNHSGETEVRNAVAATCGDEGYTGDTYCLGCNTKIADGTTIPATGNHTGGTATCCNKAVCTVCGNEYGEVNANNHVGGTEIRDAVAADCGNDGYTGDTYCLGCDQKIADGTVIPATGNHTGGTATCCTKAKCDVCGNEYGELDADNHHGETEIRNAVAPGYTEEGYTGDTYCLGCGEMIEKGEVIAPLGLLGDVNRDGYINSIDSKIIAQYFVGLTQNLNTAVADVNGDGSINTEDARLITQYYVGLIEKFPIE